MDSYINYCNFFGNAAPEKLLSEYGSPLYVYNENILRNSMRNVANIVTKYPFTCNYSIKANSNLKILKIALEEGLNCDAMSEGEIRLLQMAGFPNDRIFYVPNNVSKEELQFAIDNSILTSLDSIAQLELYGQLNPGGRCAIRINPGVGAGHHEKVVTAGKNTKFAIASDDLDEAISVARKYDLRIIGINQHVGSLFMNPDAFLSSCRNILHFAERFDRLDFIDFGGGFGVPYHKLSGEEAFDFASLTLKLTDLLDEFVDKVGYTPLFKTEPGRYVPCESAILLGKVYSVKTNADKKYVGTDIGMNVLMRPVLYDSWHDIEVIRNNEVVLPSDKKEKVNVVGNICETGDIIAKERELPIIYKDDIIAVLDAGAYGFSMSSNYNMRYRPAEVMIGSDGNPVLIRRRETFEDLIRQFT
ncbi:MAG: diaminopimelate decarboxylase [Clostridia bacterium]|nr:diaminopimelate decarboxylase [Clostridia bacterium]